MSTAPVGLILLAAGGSSRLGTPKQLLRTADGQTLLRRAAQTALASVCRPITVVLGASADATRREVEDLPLSMVVNPDWATGIASSLRIGLAAVRADAALDAVVIILCDQPRVSDALLDSLVTVRQTSGHDLVACEYDDVLGVPALFGNSLFGALAALDGDEGARKIIRNYRGPLTRVPFPGGHLDIDTPEQITALTAVPQSE